MNKQLWSPEMWEAVEADDFLVPGSPKGIQPYSLTLLHSFNHYKSSRKGNIVLMTLPYGSAKFYVILVFCCH